MAEERLTARAQNFQSEEEPVSLAGRDSVVPVSRSVPRAEKVCDGAYDSDGMHLLPNPSSVEQCFA